MQGKESLRYRDRRSGCTGTGDLDIQGHESLILQVEENLDRGPYSDRTLYTDHDVEGHKSLKYRNRIARNQGTR
jgi:hypothetical protein